MLSIGEILRIECFRNATLLTNVDLDVPTVGSVTVGEVPDIAQWLSGGEMVLTTLFTAREARDEKFETVRNIINGPAGALVVKLGRFVESLPDGVIELANEKRFPILSLPAEVRWTNVITGMSRMLGQQELAKLTWLESIRHQFGRDACGDRAISSIAKKLSGLIGCHIIIEDLLGGILAPEPDSCPLPGGYTAVPALIQTADASRNCSVEHMVSPNYYRYLNIVVSTPITTGVLAFEIDDGHGHCGYLVVTSEDYDDVVSIDENQILAIEKAVEAINIEMSKMRASIDAEMRLVGSLFAMLNSGNLSRQEAIRRASFLQIDLVSGFLVCVINLVLPVENPGYRAVEQIKERSVGLVKRIVSTYFPGSLVALDGEKINMLLVPPPTIDPARRPGLVGSAIERIAEALRDAVPAVTFNIGASSFHVNAEDVNMAHNEAATAALISSATGRANTVSKFRDLGLYKLLLYINRSHPEEAQRFYIDTLGAVEEYDRKRESSLMYTLEVFFACRESINETAVKLFTHRHTVRYRLQRIAELSELDPLDPNNREVLRVAVKLKQLSSLE